MPRPRRSARLLTLALGAWASVSLAHVPFIETEDYDSTRPFTVEDVTQSKAIYGWLDAASDHDVFVLEVPEATRIYTHSLVPYCEEYRDFTVTYALIGPGLPASTEPLPVELPEGAGAVIVRETLSADRQRPVTYEPFSARSYFQGPEFAVDAAAPGQYQLVVWNEAGRMGDYVAVVGEAEQFGALDIVRATRHTITLRRQAELHTSCTTPPEGAQVASN